MPPLRRALVFWLPFLAALVVHASPPGPAQRTYEPPGPSSRRTGITISEIQYHPAAEPAPAGSAPDLEFLELYNSNPFFEDLSGWRLDGEVNFVFPTNSILAANARIVIAADPAALKSRHGITNVAGPWAGHLSDGGGTVRLHKRSDAVVLEVAYRDSAPWPVAADGTGHSLVLVRPSYGENDPHAWAASAAPGGSPGLPDPVPDGPLEAVVINELLANTDAPAVDFIELHNHSTNAVDLAGCWLSDDPATNKFRIPDGTRMEAGGFIAFDQTLLGFSLDAGGETVYFRSPEGRVIDAIRYGAQATAISWGRSPDGSSSFRELANPTSAHPNAAPFPRPIVINEIFYNPPDGSSEGEFVELFNRGTAGVDLSGWRFVDGIDFEFPATTILPAGGYMVVARNSAKLRADHPALPASSVVGDFTGTLSNNGERIALAMPEIERVPDPATGGFKTHTLLVLVNEVTYGTGGRWSRWADGGGSSLELIDPRADNQLPGNWAASDESAKSSWETIERAASLTLPHTGVPNADQLQAILLGAGEVLLDDVSVTSAGVNRIANGTFETGLSGWAFQGTHRLASLETNLAFTGKNSLRLSASERGDHVANRARTQLSATIAAGVTTTIRARARWVRGHPEFLLRLRGNALEAAARLTVPANLGTPGERNSRAVPNAPPTLFDVAHWPVLPRANEPIRITARAADPDGIASVQAIYRIDPSSVTQSVPLVDDGTGADEFAGDGIYSGTIPGLSGAAGNTLLAFMVRATDRAEGTPATATFPAGAPAREALVRVGEPIAANAFGTYRLWLTRATVNAWSVREKMSNEDLDGTFVYGTNRVFYNIGAHYSGSSYTSPGYDSPVGALCGYDLNFRDDDRFLGETQSTLDWPIRDDTGQREQLMFWFLEQYGLPNMYRRHVTMYVNGLRRGAVYEDVQQPGSDTIREWFPGDDQGSLWKTDCWNEFDNLGNRIDPCILNTLEKFPATGAKNLARYRWNWRPRAVKGSANDFSDLFALVDAANVSQNYVSSVESIVDVEHWMRTFAMNDLASFWDAFGNGNAKNTFLYKPEFDGWKLFCWDFDVGLGVFNDPTNYPLFDAGDPVVSRIQRQPAWLRLYWNALQEAVEGFFQTPHFGPLLDAKYAAFKPNNITLGNPSGIKTWITQRRTFLLTQLNTVKAGFSITTQAGKDFSTNRELVTLTGTAPVNVRTLRVNGQERPVNWTTVSNWNISLNLAPGTNALVVEGFDRLGSPVAGAQRSVKVNFAGDPSDLPRIVFNEWMASNRHALADPADGAFDDWFELYNAGGTTVNLAGFTLTDSTNAPAQYVIPAGFSLAPGAFLLVWADQQPEQTRAGADLHANFKLGQDGEYLALHDAGGRLVDSVAFGKQDSDISEGRYPDGASIPTWRFSAPSPRAANPVPVFPPGEFQLVKARTNPAGLLELTWRSIPGQRYQVRSCPALSPEDWTDGAEIIATDVTTTGTDPAPPGTGARFYQVVQLP